MPNFPGLSFMQSGYAPNAINYNGTTNYLNRGANFTGISNSSTGIFSAWYDFSSLSGPILFIPNATNVPFSLIINSSKFRVRLQDSSASNLVVMDSSTLSTGSWVNILLSWNVNFSSGSRLLNMLVNGVSDKNVIADIGSAFTQSFTSATDWFVGVNSNASDGFFDGCMAEVYFAPGQYLDFTNSSNVRKFISASGKPADLSTSGAPTPILYLKGNAANVAVNSGTGGNMTSHGTFSNCSSHP